MRIGRAIVASVVAVGMTAGPLAVVSAAPKDDVVEVPADLPADAPLPVGDSANEKYADTSIAGLFDERAKDLYGILPSLYQGKWFDPKKEKMRKCIVNRESRGNYTARSGIYHGAYQMNDAVGDGAAWMMQKEVRKELGKRTAIKMMRGLRKQPVSTWNRYWQDRAFWTIWRLGKGKHHWAGGAHRC